MSAIDEMISRFTPEEREAFLEMMRDKNTYVAEDMKDVLAILTKIRPPKE